MTYSVKEIFFTLQGEGAQSGRPAVFCRFTGCNLWSGKEKHRDKAICQFCDTEFVGVDGEGGGKFRQPEDLAAAIAACWPDDAGQGGRPYVVCTGGEPLLQLDEPLIDALHARGFEVAVETNGTQRPPAGIDWLCVSPKAGAPLMVDGGDEIKLVYPQMGAEPERFAGLDFGHFYLQPMDGPNAQQNTLAALRYCHRHTRWRLSLQTHKILDIP
jgi:7-carboxy-7-deazaguanine synthase (Cx14CxxC type)